MDKHAFFPGAPKGAVSLVALGHIELLRNPQHLVQFVGWRRITHGGWRINP